MTSDYLPVTSSLCARSLRLLGRGLEHSGTLHEYYNPFSGEPVMNGDFVNWNALVLNMADELRGKQPMDSLING